MRVSLRFILLLVLSIALRGFAAPSYALPSTPAAPVEMSDCYEHGDHQALHAHHQADDKACQISCDLTVSPALPVSFVKRSQAAPPVLAATLPVLILREAMPPDHPPPIL